MQNLDARRAKRILLVQAVVALIVALLGLPIDLSIARDALLGGIAATGGSFLFYYWTFGRYNAQQPGKIVTRFFGGELIKISFIVIIFALAMKQLDDLQPVALLLAYFVVQVFPPLLANKIAR